MSPEQIYPALWKDVPECRPSDAESESSMNLREFFQSRQEFMWDRKVSDKCTNGVQVPRTIGIAACRWSALAWLSKRGKRPAIDDEIVWISGNSVTAGGSLDANLAAAVRAVAGVKP